MGLALSSNEKIAVIDSGVGGLSVLAELRRALPHYSIIYYGDSANCPYGSKSSELIVELTIGVVSRVVQMGAGVVVVACNTMTAAAIDVLRCRWPKIDFVGMEPAIKPALAKSRSGAVGVLATEATFRGKLYRQTKEEYLGSETIVEVAGVGLVEFVERGEQHSEQCERLVASYLEPMFKASVDSVVLGCTHYPFLIPTIERVIAQKRALCSSVLPIEVMNPALAIARRVVQIVERRGIVGESVGELVGESCIDYHSTGDSEQRLFLENFLDKYSVISPSRV